MAANKTNSPFPGSFPDFSKVFAEFRAPALDFTSFFNIQRRNVEAFSAAHQVMAESFQALSRRQAELFQEQVETVLKHHLEKRREGVVPKPARAQLPRIAFEEMLRTLCAQIR